MRLIITGGAGFIGRNVVRAFLVNGYDVEVIDNVCDGALKGIDRQLGCKVNLLDIRDFDKIRDVFNGAYGVIHLAAVPRVQLSIDKPYETYEHNVTGTLNVLRASLLANVKKFIFVSTSAVYGEQEHFPISESATLKPQSPYALHKIMGEKFCKDWNEKFGLRTTIFRLFNVYGDGQQDEGVYSLVIKKFLEQYKNNVPLSITGDGNQTRDFVHVQDIARAFLLALESDNLGNGEIINIGSGREISINKLADLFSKEIVYLPARFEPKRTYADITLARKLLNWEPSISLEEGIDELKRGIVKV